MQFKINFILPKKFINYYFKNCNNFIEDRKERISHNSLIYLKIFDLTGIYLKPFLIVYWVKLKTDVTH